jgi:dipeptidyl aminopeptidase/acylaminoacyl peptidase
MPNRDVVRATKCLVATLCIACGGADITQLSTQPPLQPEQDPLRPPPSPQVVTIEGRIAFESTRDGEPWIYVTTSESLTVRRLTRGQRPAISWDGTRVAFQTWLSGSPPIVSVINSDGTNERVIGPGESPAWSPDGRQIVFTRYGNPGGGLFVVSPDGGAPVRVLSDEFEARDHWLGWPAWSPDGRRIAFTHGGTTDWYSYADPVGIYLVNADGSEPRSLTGIPAYWEQDAVWSADGARVLFLKGGFRGSLVSTDTAGKSERVHGYGFRPDWSPDGLLISYYRHTIPPGPEHRMRIFVTTREGQELQLIPDAVSAHHPYSDLNASWSRTRR